MTCICFAIRQVETAGDCYIVSAGILSSETQDGFSSILDQHHDHRASARCVMEFAKAVLQEAAKVGISEFKKNLQTRLEMPAGTSFQAPNFHL